MSNIITEEFAHSINGVSGRMFARTVGGSNYKPNTFTNQKWISETRNSGKREFMKVKIRFDDQCRNGHNTFSITCDIYEKRAIGQMEDIGGGAAHDEIARVFPELAPLIKWHLNSTDSPLHYVANSVYLASNRDYRGKLKGEAYAWDNVVYIGDSPVSHKLKSKFAEFVKSRMVADQDGGDYLNAEFGEFRVVAIAHGDKGKTGGQYQFDDKYTFVGFGEKWHECPFDTEQRAQEFADAFNNLRCSFQKIPTLFSEGKERDLDAARRAANWPEATDEILMLDKAELTAILESRLPALNDEFRAAMTEAGFLWAPEAA